MSNDSPYGVPRDLSDEALRFIVRLHSGKATRADREAFAAWRSASPERERAAHEAEAIWSDASGLSEDRVTGALKPGDDPERPSRRKLLGVAAVLASGGGAGWLAFNGELGFADYATGRAETQQALLPGLRVTLDARSALDVSDGTAALLKGQALFESTPGSQRLLRVFAGPLQIVPERASFVVDMAGPGGGLTLSVVERGVRLSTALTPLVELAAPRSVTVDRGGKISAAETIDAAAAIAWRDGRLIAENRRLDDVAGRIARYHQGLVVVREDVAALKVSAVLDLRAPAASLDALAAALPISITRLSPYLTIIGHA